MCIHQRTLLARLTFLAEVGDILRDEQWEKKAQQIQCSLKLCFPEVSLISHGDGFSLVWVWGIFGVWLRLAKPGIRPGKWCYFIDPAGQENNPVVTHLSEGGGCCKAVGTEAEPGKCTAGNADGHLGPCDAGSLLSFWDHCHRPVVTPAKPRLAAIKSFPSVRPERLFGEISPKGVIS